MINATYYEILQEIICQPPTITEEQVLPVMVSEIFKIVLSMSISTIQLNVPR